MLYKLISISLWRGTSMQLSAAVSAARCLLSSTHTYSLPVLTSALPLLRDTVSPSCSNQQQLPAELASCSTVWDRRAASSTQGKQTAMAGHRRLFTSLRLRITSPMSLLHIRQHQTSCAQLIAPQPVPSSRDQHQHEQQHQEQQQQQQQQQQERVANQQDPPSAPPLSQDVTYQGPLSQTHKLLKRVSIANTAIALAAAPAIVMYADVSYVSRLGLAASLIAFGILTTGALHWVTHPYVHELHYTAATHSCEAKTTTLFGRAKLHRFRLSDVQPLPWNRPVATFMANDRYYYIDVYSFPDEELLKRLTPPDDQVPPGYKDDKDDD